MYIPIRSFQPRGTSVSEEGAASLRLASLESETEKKQAALSYQKDLFSRAIFTCLKTTSAVCDAVVEKLFKRSRLQKVILLRIARLTKQVCSVSMLHSCSRFLTRPMAVLESTLP